MKTPRLGAGLRLALRHVPGWMLLVSVAGLVASGLSVVTAFALAGLVGDLLAGAPIGGSLGLALGSVFARGRRSWFATGLPRRRRPGWLGGSARSCWMWSCATG